MKVKTADLTGAALDYAVSMTCEFQYGTPRRSKGMWIFPLSRPDWKTLGAATLDFGGWWKCNVPAYSTDWGCAGPLIDMHIKAIVNDAGQHWYAHTNDHVGFGETALIAAMRAIVASELGEEVEIPEEFTETDP